MVVYKKKILLIGIALTFFAIIITVLIFLVIGMGHGYDSAMIMNTIEKKCNCKVEAIHNEPNQEDFVNDLKSSEIVKIFTMQLTDCKYDTLNQLKEDIVNISIENKLCEDRNIQFMVPDFKSTSEMFTIQNCNL